MNSYTEQYKTKKHKDLSFLTVIEPQSIFQKIHKYSIIQGKGDPIKIINLPLSIYYNYDKYDYTGKMIERIINKSVNYPMDPNSHAEKNTLVLQAIYSMKVNQKSWFNIELSQRGCKDYHGFNGYHYEIYVDSISYRNDNNIVSKRLIYQQNRQKAKLMFKNKKYKEALKIYKNSINILSGLSKKIYKQEELVELGKYLEISESNYLKCVAKLNGFGGRYNEEITRMTKELSEKFMRNNPNSPVSFYRKAIYLKYDNRFDAASDAIKEGLKQNFSQDHNQSIEQKNSLLKMLQQIKKTKQRNVRHLAREQLRKKKLKKIVNQVWEDEQFNDLEESI